MKKSEEEEGRARRKQILPSTATETVSDQQFSALADIVPKAWQAVRSTPTLTVTETVSGTLSWTHVASVQEARQVTPQISTPIAFRAASETQRRIAPAFAKAQP